jgi:hypothetical protein
VDSPRLLITADPGLEAIVSEEDAAAIKTVIPQLRVADIPKTGHSVRREQFVQYIHSVRTFLIEVSPNAE